MLHIILSLALAAAAPDANRTTVGSVQPEAAGFSKLVPAGAKIQVLAEGFTWTEGPVWIREGGYLLFSDPPKNRMYRWAPGDRSASVFLEPSGGSEMRGFREAGSNGLKRAGTDHLLVADQGDRGIALLNLRSKAKRLLVQLYEGKKLNSPNDVAVASDGAIWLTDPPYGLEGIDDSPKKEQTANRVYRLAPDGKLTAAVSELRYPNGLAFSPDGRTLYVSNSDPKNAVILAFDVSRTGALSGRRGFADMNALAAKGLPGLPDGMTVDERGNLWASGPGGIHVINPDGRELGLISTGAAISNCAFGGADGRTLFMTSTHQIVALRTNVRGAPARVPKLAGLLK
ncbi:MAG TPA: SMP-30/gluconolactonase/LRE family protein [Sphingomicrobium sp.]